MQQVKPFIYVFSLDQAQMTSHKKCQDDVMQ